LKALLREDAALNNHEPYEEDPPRGIWSRVRERVFGPEEEYESEDPPLRSADAKRRATLRLDTARALRVDVRRNATTFNDARVAADGLKGGQQQVVNLERASPEMAERIIDFLNGCTYALDGTVEKIGEKVYLFAPANIDVELDSGSEIR
jgi:cell division inhibitor SepF